jgi:putative ABC transport system permease protein
MASLGEIAEDSAAPTRLVMWLLGVFGAVALVLAAIGVYGVLSYTVRQRLREFATRMALGATHGDILWLVLRDGTVIVGMGLLAGLLISTVATRALQSLLFAVTAHDPFTLVAAAAALVAATLLGCYLPARRAAKVQPARTLAE